MTKFLKRLESHKNLRITLMCASFVVAAFSLFMGAAIYLFIQYGDNLLIACFLVLALFLDIGIGWMLHLHTRQSLRVTMLLSSTGIMMGAIVVSILVWRAHWVQLIKELFAVT